MTEIEILHDKIYSDANTKDPKQFIIIYEENKTLIENADPSISNPDFDGIIRIISDYAMALSHYGSSKKSIPYLDKSIQLFRNSSLGDLTKILKYEILIWTRGVENYNNKNYGVASEDFQYLVDNYPDNDKYRNWLLASKTIKIKKWLNFFWYGGLICLVWQTMLNKDNPYLKDNLLLSSVILFILAILTEIIIALIKSNIKQKGQQNN
jgi:hypothetical protein